MEFTEEQVLQRVKTGSLFTELENNKVECFACAHRCKIRPNKSGICKVRYNDNGVLKVPWGYVAALHNDPIEKKPFYHAFPNSYALSIGMLGCNLKCDYCQNWQISQTLKDPDAGVKPRDVSVDDVVNYALNLKSRSIISTYNEPLITSEWAHAIFTEAKKHKLATGYVSSGNTTPEVVDFLKPVTDLYKIDLKSFDDRGYRKLGASLDKILKSIQDVHRKGLWMEIVTLVVPDFNNSDDEIRGMAEFLADISPDIPWHLSAYHQDYKMKNENTRVEDLIRAAEIGTKAGLNYIYVGNVSGRTNKWKDTHCPDCGTMLVEREGWQVTSYNITENSCSKCGKTIPGYWEPPEEKKRHFDLF